MSLDWDWAYTAEIAPLLGTAFVVTVQATLLGFGIALVLGLVLALLRRTPLILIRWPTIVVIEFVRATPLLVQLYFLYFVLPGWGITLDALTVGVLGLGLHYSTYTSEVYRGGIEHVPKGQWEAARALNLSTWRTYRDIIIPQAIPPVVPALGNYLIAMFKDSPLLSAITVVEILQQAKIIGSERFQYLEPLTLTGIAFLLVSIVSAQLVQFTERRLPRHGITMD